MMDLPVLGGGQPIPLAPAVTALGRVVIAGLSSSTTRNLTAGTTFIRLYATSQDVYLKWGATAVTASNFDEVIPAGMLTDLIVPIDKSTKARYTTIRLIERAATAGLVLIEK